MALECQILCSLITDSMCVAMVTQNLLFAVCSSDLKAVGWLYHCGLICKSTTLHESVVSALIVSHFGMSNTLFSDN